MKRRYDLYLKDILKAIEKVQEYTSDIQYEDFKDNDLVKDAVVWNLGLIGEAVSQVDEDVKEKYEEVSWQKIKDFRNIAYHKYHSLDLEIIWDIVQNKLDPLKNQVENILEKE